MDVGTRVVVTVEDSVRLVTISEPVHIFPPDDSQLFVREHAIGVGIERETDHRSFHPAVHGKIRFEAARAFGGADLSIRYLHHTALCQCPHFPFLHFSLIAIQHPIDDGTGYYLCNHCPNSLVGRMISLFNDTGSTVGCSSL